jgi:hypothetical protein
VSDYARGFDDAERGRLRAIFDYIQGTDFQDFGSEYAAKSEADYAGRFRNITDEQGQTTQVEYADPDAPARLTDLPTSSTNASRPRTVAAGYDKARQVMTVVFRDGTIYNYYDVRPGEWENFHDSVSKGRPWLNRAAKNPAPGAQAVDGLFINKPQGPADLSNVDPDVMSEIYKIVRTSQVRYSNARQRKVTFADGSSRMMRNVAGKNVRTKSQLSPRSSTSRKLGKNPSSGGKNPNQK